MAEMDEDKDVSRRYRELPREEPPPGLDAKIRAEARSALETRAAPLVAPTGRRRWYFPVAAAAVIVLAVAVTTQVEREEIEVKKEAVLQEKPQVAAQVAEERLKQPAKTDALAKRRVEPQPFEQQQQKDRAMADATAGERSRENFSRDYRERQERPAASPPAAAGAVASPPAVASRQTSTIYTVEGWLERIAALRAQGKDEEADKELAEFRKRFPDYEIPPETLKKVERSPR